MFFFHYAVNTAWKLAMFVKVEYIVKARYPTEVTFLHFMAVLWGWRLKG